MHDHIEITHPVDTPENAGAIMFGLLHSFAQLAQKYPDAFIEQWIVQASMLALERRLPESDAVIDERTLVGIKSLFNACMYRDTCRALAATNRQPPAAPANLDAHHGN
jgi:hypothetical protein